ncbi:MAG: response regulator [Gemmataceae bacterium]
MSETLRLFLVEDDDDFAYLMRKSLERDGHEVTVCHAAADALIVLGGSTHFDSPHFDLVLLDQRLPDMAGLELLQTLNREGFTSPVLFVTGYGDEHLAAQVLRAGALDYVVKDRALTFLTDLPKRVRESVTRHRLLQVNRLLIEALESARDGVLITDLQGAIFYVNQALEEMLGYSREELIGQPPRLFKSGLHNADFYSTLWQMILNRESWQGEIVNRRKDGTLVETSCTISPIVDHRGQLTNFVAIYRDVSERKLMERQLFQAQKMQSVGTLAGGVAHEFNNLLAGIQGYATLGLREKGVPQQALEFFQFIVDLSDRAANLTRQLLAFARKPALTRAPTSLSRLLHGTANLVQRTLKVEVRVEIDSADDDHMALADQNQLQQVLINLALNARDAMAETPASVVLFRLSRRRLVGNLAAFPENVPAGEYLVIEVEDKGRGMSPDVMAQAFDPFFTTKDIGQGTGLGLPVAFGIIHGHQGFLTLDSQVGGGASVCIFLPRLAEAPGEANGVPEHPLVLEPEASAARSILLVDDEQAVLDVVRRFLEIAGHTVHTASSGAAALALVKNGAAIEMAILDLMIPGEEGLSNFRALRERLPRVPILLCTGLVQADQAGEMLREGASDLLRKPFRMNELWHAVNRCLTATG